MIGRKSDLSYFNKLVDQCSNYHRSVIRKPVNADYSALTKDIESSHKPPKFKVNAASQDKVRITKYKNIFSKVYTKSCSREIFVIDSTLQTMEKQ